MGMVVRRKWVARSIRGAGKYRRKRRRAWTVLVNEAVCSVVKKIVPFWGRPCQETVREALTPGSKQAHLLWRCPRILSMVPPSTSFNPLHETSNTILSKTILPNSSENVLPTTFEFTSMDKVPCLFEEETVCWKGYESIVLTTNMKYRVNVCIMTLCKCVKLSIAILTKQANQMNRRAPR